MDSKYEYPWAANLAKVARAVDELEAGNQKVTEEAIKKLYIKYGGLVLEVEKKKKK